MPFCKSLPKIYQRKTWKVSTPILPVSDFNKLSLLCVCSLFIKTHMEDTENIPSNKIFFVDVLLQAKSKLLLGIRLSML